jgi:hypothetical protein
MLVRDDPLQDFVPVYLYQRNIQAQSHETDLLFSVLMLGCVDFPIVALSFRFAMALSMVATGADSSRV